jgi:hypothetical protein
MGGWFSKWSVASYKPTVTNAKVITDPTIIKEFEDQLYGIELSRLPKREVSPITQAINNSVI